LWNVYNSTAEEIISRPQGRRSFRSLQYFLFYSQVCRLFFLALGSNVLDPVLFSSSRRDVLQENLFEGRPKVIPSISPVNPFLKRPEIANGYSNI
jgi:hypothetical protein